MVTEPHAFARRLCKSSTRAEVILWDRHRGAKFKRQVPIDRYVVDFFRRAAELVVEFVRPLFLGRRRPKPLSGDNFPYRSGQTLNRPIRSRIAQVIDECHLVEVHSQFCQTTMIGEANDGERRSFVPPLRFEEFEAVLGRKLGKIDRLDCVFGHFIPEPSSTHPSGR